MNPGSAGILPAEFGNALHLSTALLRQASRQDACAPRFELWKDADADLPVLIEAKKEYEKLK